MDSEETMFHQPCDLLVLPLSWLDLQALVVHLVHIARTVHVAEDIILKIANGPQRIRDVLELLDVANHVGGLGPLRKVDEVGAFDDGGDAVFDEGEVGQENTYAGSTNGRT